MASKASVHRSLRVGGEIERGADVTALQREINARLNARSIDQRVVVDGEYGPKTHAAALSALYYLGVTRASVGMSTTKPTTLTQAAQSVLRAAVGRTKSQRARGEKRVMANHKRDVGRLGAVRWAGAQVGTRESPANSNRGPKITEWQRALGSWLVGLAWCGVFVGTALIRAGVKGVTSRIASVAMIEDDARAGRGPFRGWTTDASRARAGDLAVIGGRGVHVELVVGTHADGSADTIGGNTSAGVAGSQSDGGGVFRRHRSRAEIHGFALVKF